MGCVLLHTFEATPEPPQNKDLGHAEAQVFLQDRPWAWHTVGYNDGARDFLHCAARVCCCFGDADQNDAVSAESPVLSPATPPRAGCSQPSPMPVLCYSRSRAWQECSAGPSGSWQHKGFPRMKFLLCWQLSSLQKPLETA